ncbi:hypothetical protein [Nocardiopsis sp. ATB16-24]|uniref:hypothetical protein n=1 Tax=Nocardiopsis sp. ATB16-24 TaxID=3019555 RepID=UPI0025573270|nr:hypothetical protein [Nocardiopsis sp. ATB16-24]
MKRNLLLVLPVVIFALVLKVYLFIFVYPSSGSHESTGETLLYSLSMAGVLDAKEELKDDPRGPVRELLVTEYGALAVFDDGVALWGTKPVAEVWSFHGLEGPVAAGVTADGAQIVLAADGGGLLSGSTRWMVLDGVTGQLVAEHRAQESPSDLVSLLTNDARLLLSEKGQVTARGLKDDQELWSMGPWEECGEPEIQAVGDTVAIVAACGDEIRLTGLAAESGQKKWEYRWPGAVVPELLLLTPRTVPGGADDPVERLVRGDLADGYVMFGRGEVFDRARGQEYLPPQTEMEKAPAYVVLIEDLQDADARLVLQSAHVMLEEGLIDLEELEEESLLVDGQLPISVHDWGGDPRMMVADLNTLLSEA